MARGESQDWLSVGWIVSYPLLAVLAAMIFLSAEEMLQSDIAINLPAPVVADAPNWPEDFAPRVEALHLRVMEAPLGASVSSEDRQGAGALRWTHRLLEVTVDRDNRAEVDAVVETLRALDPGVTVVTEERFNGSQVLVGLDGLLTHTLRIYWSDEPTRPRVGLVVAALGDDLKIAREVIELEPPVAVGILPFRPFSAQVGELAKIFERDVLLDWGESGQRHGLDAALATVPGAIGAVVHGDTVEDELLVELRDHGLFVVRAGAAESAVVAMPLGDGTVEAFDSISRRARAGGRAIAVTGGAADRDGVGKMRGLLARWDKEEIDVVKVSQFFAPPST